MSSLFAKNPLTPFMRLHDVGETRFAYPKSADGSQKDTLMQVWQKNHDESALIAKRQDAYDVLLSLAERCEAKDTPYPSLFNIDANMVAELSPQNERAVAFYAIPAVMAEHLSQASLLALNDTPNVSSTTLYTVRMPDELSVMQQKWLVLSRPPIHVGDKDAGIDKLRVVIDELEWRWATRQMLITELKDFENKPVVLKQATALSIDTMMTPEALTDSAYIPHKLQVAVTLLEFLLEAKNTEGLPGVETMATLGLIERNEAFRARACISAAYQMSKKPVPYAKVHIGYAALTGSQPLFYLNESELSPEVEFWLLQMGYARKADAFKSAAQEISDFFADSRLSLWRESRQELPDKDGYQNLAQKSLEITSNLIDKVNRFVKD